MEGWGKLQSSIGSINFGQSASKLVKGFNSSVQATKERLGQVAPDEITELPQGAYLSSSQMTFRLTFVQSTRISKPALMPSAQHISPYSSWDILLSFLSDSNDSHRITKVYESESYDYPTQIQESISELSISIGHGITNFAATNLKGTNLPVPSPVAAPQSQHKTLPHALGRASTTAATALQDVNVGTEDKLGKALGLYAGAFDKIASARLHQDASIQSNFLHPWQTTLSTSIAVALKARQAVRVSRLELDAAKQT